MFRIHATPNPFSDSYGSTGGPSYNTSFFSGPKTGTLVRNLES